MEANSFNIAAVFSVVDSFLCSLSLPPPSLTLELADIPRILTNLRFLFILFGVTLLIGCTKLQQSRTRQLVAYEPDDAIRTAALVTDFDYRAHLQNAVRKEPDSLRALFRFTDSDAFVGAGADQHCYVLMNLLRLWGDRAFAGELASESNAVRTAVIHALDYLSEPDWRSSRNYPLTYTLAEHQKISTSPP